MLIVLIVLLVLALFGWGAIKEGLKMGQLPTDLSDELRARRRERKDRSK